MKPPKKVKAWAVIWAVKFSSSIGHHYGSLAVFPTKALAKSCMKFPNQRVIPVLITPLSERGK